MQIKPKLKNYKYPIEVELPPEEIIDSTEVVANEEIVEKVSMDISKIASTLMAAKVNFHILHLQTKSFSKHLALEELYKGVTKLGDSIIEGLLGRFNTRLEQGIIINCNPLVLDNTEQNIFDNINLFCNFACELFEWANSNNYQDTANLTAELLQIINTVKYKLTLV